MDQQEVTPVEADQPTLSEVTDLVDRISEEIHVFNKSLMDMLCAIAAAEDTNGTNPFTGSSDPEVTAWSEAAIVSRHVVGKIETMISEVMPRHVDGLTLAEILAPLPADRQYAVVNADALALASGSL